MNGNGTLASPYEIVTEADLRGLTDATKYYKLMNDITMSSTAFPSLFKGVDFTGDFNGNGKKIINLIINESGAFTGFISVVNGGSIHDLGLENISVTSTSGNYTGAITGYLQSSMIERCYSTGIVNQTNATQLICGGLVGNNSLGTIQDSWSSCTVNGGNRVGGLIGSNNGNLYRSYSIGKPTAKAATSVLLGGLVGQRIGGSYDIVQSCYWDKDASGVTVSNGSGITALTTTQAKTQAAYSGFSFGSVWNIVTDDYPKLKAFIKQANIKALTVTSTMKKVVGVGVKASLRYAFMKAISKPIVSNVLAGKKVGKSIATYANKINGSASNIVRHINSRLVVVSAAISPLLGNVQRQGKHIANLTALMKKIVTRALTNGRTTPKFLVATTSIEESLTSVVALESIQSNQELEGVGTSAYMENVSSISYIENPSRLEVIE